MRLFYRKYGSGVPLIILHGLYGSSDNWITIAKSISSLFTVYLPDQRNHGESPHSEHHDYEAMSSDLYEFATENNLKKFYLAGHSMGGKTAIRFAMRWPEMIMGLVIADITPFGTSVLNSGSYTEHINILSTITKIDISAAKTRSDIEKMLEPDIPSARTRALLLKNVRRNSAGGFEWKINNRALYDNLDTITGNIVTGISANEPITGFPVLFLKGENSAYLPDADIKPIKQLFPAAEFMVIKNAGHWLHTDNPEAVTAVLMSLPDK